MAMWDKISYVVQLVAACALFMIPFRKKNHYVLRITAGSLLLIAASYLVNTLYTVHTVNLIFFLYWGSYIVSCGLLVGFVLDGGWMETVFCTVCICAMQHIAFDAYLIAQILLGDWYVILVLVFVFAYVMFYFLFIRKIPKHMHFSVGRQALLPMVTIIVLVWILSTLSETGMPIFQAAGGQKILFRVIDALCCIYVLWVQITIEDRISLQRELTGINHAWRMQASQYHITKRTIDSINRKSHDLKHQIQALRQMTSENQKQAFFDEIENDVMMFDTALDTGNKALDIVLMEKGMYCNNHGIQWSCMADASRLDFMRLEDIYAIFGNALDNAIEEVLSLDNPQKRVISVKIITQKNIVMIQIQNYFRGRLRFEDGLPLTTKQNTEDHGFGIKSIRYIAEKYNGTIAVETQGDIFNLQILLPVAVD